jgi:hypothetical protein
MTPFSVEAYPTLFRIVGFKEIRLHVQGPIQNFTCQLCLDRGKVALFGMSQEGFFRFELYRHQQELVLSVVRAPEEGIRCSGLETSLLKRHDRIRLALGPLPSLSHSHRQLEKLCCGIHKEANIDRMWRSFKLEEHLPFLYLLGQQIQVGSSKLPLSWVGSLEQEIRAHFQQGWVPRLEDSDHQGLKTTFASMVKEPLELYYLVYRWVKDSLCRQDNDHLTILPNPCSIVGRWTGYSVEGGGTLDLQWSRFRPRKMRLYFETSRELTLASPGITRVQIRTLLHQKGRWHNLDTPILFSPHTHYYLERFS